MELPSLLYKLLMNHSLLLRSSSRTASLLDLCENLIDPFGPPCVPSSNQIWVINNLLYCCSFILWRKADFYGRVIFVALASMLVSQIVPQPELE